MTLLEPHAEAPKRHKNFEETHAEIIGTAVRHISESGVESVSIAAVARDLGINRTTVYYHFKSREELIDAVKLWSAERIAQAFDVPARQEERIDFITRFVIDNPEIIKLWIDDFIAVGDIRDRYPHWDALVAGIERRLAAHGEKADAEVYCVIMLTSAIIGPRVFRNSVNRAIDAETIIRRFRLEQQRLLKHDDLLKP